MIKQVRSGVPGLRRRSLCKISASASTQTATVKLGKSNLEVSEMGLGAWSWGDRSNYWVGWTKEGSRAAYDAAMAAGLTFIDTAEVYGFGTSEDFVGEFIRESSSPMKPTLATKFAPLPWRQTADSVVGACQKSLKRLQQERIGLYMIHWPGFFLNAFSNDAYVEGLARCHEQGLCEGVGVSNFNAQRVRGAARSLESRGTCLASNQVQYSLL
jgi:aryl-alcohol dehydrogenase-like predicted oxidoreductase